MSLVQLCFVGNLLECFTDLSSFIYNSSGHSHHRYDEAFHIPHCQNFYT